jgi:hypothetical protein
MISAVECRQHAVEYHQMSERAPSLRVRDILIDMARTWERLALETDHARRQVRKLCCALNSPDRPARPTLTPSTSQWVAGFAPAAGYGSHLSRALTGPVGPETKNQARAGG